MRPVDRRSGTLNPDEQRAAQELFDAAVSKDGYVRAESDNFAYVRVKDSRKRQLSMELTLDSRGFGQVALGLRRGRRGWHDDGAEGWTGIFVTESSVIGPESFHPNVETRDGVLKEVHRLIVRPQI